MFFWIFMLIMVFLTPVTIIIFGRYFLSGRCKPNGIFGYRTNMANKNEYTCAFAHAYCGRIWFWSGVAMLPLSLAAMLLTLGKSVDTIGTVGTIAIVVQGIVMCVPIIFTEVALRRNFDKDGNPKQ